MPDGSRSLLCQNDGMQPAGWPNTGHAFERQRLERRIRRVKSALAALEDRTTRRSGEDRSRARAPTRHGTSPPSWVA
jgi:hypothetical protein